MAKENGESQAGFAEDIAKAWDEVESRDEEGAEPSKDKAEARPRDEKGRFKAEAEAEAETEAE